MTQQATVLAYNHVFLLVAALFLVVLPLVLLLKRGDHTEAVEVLAD